MHFNKIYIVALYLLLLTIACGDDDDINYREGYYAGVECPRLQLNTFDDCQYKEEGKEDGELDLNSKESIAGFCQSTCDSIRYVYGTYNDGGPEDFALLKGIRKVDILHVDGIHNLRSLHGLESLEVAEKMFMLVFNFNLASVEALSSLERVGGPFTIQSAKKLKSLRGLESLRKTEYFTLINNKELSDITAAYGLEETDHMVIEDSPLLPKCQAEYLRDNSSLDPEHVRISGLGSGSCG